MLGREMRVSRGRLGVSNKQGGQGGRSTVGEGVSVCGGTARQAQQGKAARQVWRPGRAPGIDRRVGREGFEGGRGGRQRAFVGAGAVHK